MNWKKIRKITKCFLPAGVILLVAFSEKTGFVIEGEIDTPREGTMLLITPDGQDTIARSPIVDGRFRLTGSVDSVMEVALIPEGNAWGAVPFFLENSENKYVAHLTMVDPVYSKITGGINQDIASIFREGSLKYRRKLDDVSAEMRNAGSKEKLDEAYRRYRLLKQQDGRREDSLLRVYRDTYVAAYLVYFRSRSDSSALERDSRILGPNAWNSTPGKQIKAQLARYRKLEVGRVAPYFTAVTPEGKTISLHDIGGKMKLLHFWIPGNEACEQENHKLVKIYKEFHDKGLEMVSFPMNVSREEWLNALEKNKFPWIQLTSIQNYPDVCDLYSVSTMPTLFLLDSNNKVIIWNFSLKMLRDKLKKELKEK